jgi:hypothetical protein
MDGFWFRAAMIGLLLGMAPGAAMGQGGEADLSLDSLLNTRISAASK